MRKSLKEIVFIYSTIFFFFYLVFPGSVLAKKGSFATLAEFSGEVMIKNAEEWVQPQVDMPLFSGTKIVTKEGSALVLFKDGATMAVDPFSSIRAIDQVQTGEAVSQEQIRIRKIRVMLGRTKYEEQPSAKRRTRIEMPMAVAALRGTGGYFGADEDRNSQGSLYEGNMDVSGALQELVPRILALENALNSATWVASMNSAGQADNLLTNVQEIQSELQTFTDNLDPEVQAQVRQTLEVTTQVLRDVEQKLTRSNEVQARNAVSEKATAEDSRPRVREIGQKTSESAETFVKMSQESAKTDVGLILAMLKGNKAGIALAQKAKQQNDRAVELAEKSVEMSIKASDLAVRATSDKQLDVAESSANAASNIVEALSETVKANNTKSVMISQDNEEGLGKLAGLDDVSEKILAAAEKSNRNIQNALFLAEKEETVDAAVETAKTAEDSSKVVQEVAQKKSQASQAVADDDPAADALIEETRNESDSVDQAIQSMDESNEKISALIPEEEEEEEAEEEAEEEEVEEEETEEDTEETEEPEPEPQPEPQPEIEQPIPPDEQGDDTTSPSPV